MKAAYLTTAAAIAIIAVVMIGCASTGGDGPQSDLTSYLPMAQGNTWTYDLRIRADLTPLQDHPGWNAFTQVETITGTARLQGTDYFLFSITREASGQFPETIWSQYRRADAQGIHARDYIEDQDFTLLQTPPTTGDTWTDPANANVTYQTEATGQEVTVPAGTFTCAVVKMVDGTPDEDHPERVPYTIRSWFARGVGIVQDRTYEGPAEDMTSELQLRDYEIL